MTNQRAKDAYDEAVGFRDMAAGHLADGQINEAIVATGLSSASIEIAKFAAVYQALVAGIDEDMASTQMPANPVKPQGVWGGPPTT